MEPQLYRYGEHRGLGILEVIDAVPIEPGLQRVQRKFIPSNFGPSTPPGYPQVTYDDLLLKGSGFYNVFVRDERGLEFTMRNAFWDSFVPVSEPQKLCTTSREERLRTPYESLRARHELEQKAARKTTSKYFGMLQKVFQEEGAFVAFKFDLNVTIERLVNMQYFKSKDRGFYFQKD